MSNLAAIIPSAKAPLEIHKVEKYHPGPHEILVKNEAIAFNPVEFKIAKLGVIPIQYPAILGSTFAGTIEALGSQVTNFHTGEKIATTKRFGVKGNQYGAYQRYVVVKDSMITRVPAAVDPAVTASLMMNLTCVVGLFSGRLGLEKPGLGKHVPLKSQKILVYSGSSSFGSLSVQYLAQGGYQVVTTSSPKNMEFVSKLGATLVVDHTLEAGDLVDKLTAAGPYDIVVDTISSPATLPTTGQVLSNQGGGNLYAMQPAFGPDSLPNGVTRVFEPWSEPLYEDRNQELLSWVVDTYLPHGLEHGYITPLPIEKVEGGLNGIDKALDRLHKGVSGLRLVSNPWE